MIDFNFSILAHLTGIYGHDHSEFCRMCESAELQLNIPFTGRHAVVEVDCSLLPWLQSPDAWQVTSDGPLRREPVFPGAEWIDCLDCGERVPSDLRGGHACDFRDDVVAHANDSLLSD